MKRRKFLVGAGSAAIGGSALLGSGAFSAVEAHRSMTVQIAEDPNAYLGMDDCMDADGNETPNSSYARIDEFGHLEVDMTPENPTEGGGEGVNSDSVTWADNVFQICNQGKEEICLWIDPEKKTGDDPDRVTLYVDDQLDRLTDDDPDTRELVENDDGLRTFLGVENSVPLEVGECVCVGVQVYTKEDESFNITAPSEDDQLLDEIGLVADVNEDACREPVECARLTGEYRCTTYDQEDPPDGDWRRTGTRFLIENLGDEASGYRLAVSDAPGDFRDTSIGPNATQTRVVDASHPERGVIAWQVGEDCREVVLQNPEVQTWGELKTQEGWDNLNDFYGSEAERIAAGAPLDFDDELVTEVKQIPDEEEPQEFIGDDQFPDMNQDAEDAGWVTCAKLDET